MDLTNLPRRDWGTVLEVDSETDLTLRGERVRLRVYSVHPQACLIGVTQPVGMLEGYGPEALLVKAFEKNYIQPSKPEVVRQYGFERQHGEPIELIDFVYETVFDRACEAEMNRYRHNSKNYESGRYADYLKHGLKIVFPDDVAVARRAQQDFVDDVVLSDMYQYARAICDGAKRQEARRRLGYYVAVEAVIKVNLRSLIHMARQRSAKYSPNGKEAEPQIGYVVTRMLEQAVSYLPVFGGTILDQVAKGYR